jgi:hypothetical protein
MANKKISQLTPKGSALAGTDLLEVSVFNGATYDTKSLTGANVVSGLQPTLVSGTNIKTINSTSLLGSGDIAISTGLTVGTTAIASGTIGRVLFQGTGNVLQQSAGLSFATANNQLNIGTSTYLRGGTSYLDSFANGWGLYNCGLQSTFYGNNKDIWNVNTISLGSASASARLDVRAQGALSTDIALRVRNSADSANLFSVQGDGVSNVLTRFNCGFSGMTTTGGALHVYAGNSSDFISRWFNTAGAGVISIRTVSNGGQLTISDNTGTAGLTLDGQNSNALTFGAGRNIYFDTATGTKIGATTSQKFAFWNATPIVQPTTAVASATVVSGSGGNVKHDDTFDGYTLEKVVKALRNTGLLA